jgi:hypothetical protein
MEQPPTNTEPPSASGLYLTDLLLRRQIGMSTLGRVLFVMAMAVGFFRSLLALYIQYYIWSNRLQPDQAFYLLDDYNWMYVFYTATTFAIIYMFFRAGLEGLKAFSLLRLGDTDDDALLEGHERLGNMFKWLTWWGGTYVLLLLLEYLLHYT